MIELRDKQAFSQFWGKWKKLLDGLVTDSGGKLFCPEQADVSFEETATGFQVSPKFPICFFSIPQKSSSSNDRLVVFIDGTFEFQKPAADGDASILASTHSNVAFFKPMAEGNTLKFELIDAYHFDHFAENPVQSAPHPVFHAQRNIRPDTIFKKFRDTLEVNRNNGQIVDIDQARKNELFGLKTFRLPTPQVDLFSLSAILAADHLIGQCNHDSMPYKKFKAFLDCIGHDTVKVVRLNHQPMVRAEVADKPHRFIWQWYSRH